MADIKLVKMIKRDGSKPNTADVHPAEVDNYKKGGWEVEKQESPASAKPAKTGAAKEAK